MINKLSIGGNADGENYANNLKNVVFARIQKLIHFLPPTGLH